MIKSFHVAPGWWEYESVIQQPTIEAKYAADAAVEYATANFANLDYPKRIEIQTLSYDDKNRAVIRKFELYQVPAFESREITSRK